MVTREQAFPSKYLKAADIPHQGKAYKIAKIALEKIGPEQKEKYVAYFKGEEKALVVNGSNWDLITTALREEDSDNWIAKMIELFPTTTNFGAKVVPCIRVRRYRPSQPTAATPARPVKPAPGLEEPPPWEDIPSGSEELEDV